MLLTIETTYLHDHRVHHAERKLSCGFALPNVIYLI